TPPWAGAFPEVVPHLTVAHTPSGDPAALEPVVKELTGRLPIACRARELWVMVADGSRWGIRARCPLG
ncbi:MAG: 2'-5' RNA ligase family protein, partial [Acidimicrobiales bacterium]